MKRILIPTDFSLPAENAAKYAVALAETAEADVLVCNAFNVPADAPMAAQVAWPLMDYEAMVHETNTELDFLVQKLQHSLQNKDQFVPQIELESSKGSVWEVTSQLVAQRKIDLVVMGMAGAGALSQLLLGSNSHHMIEKATFPVLYIPFEASFHPIGTLAFATDLRMEDIPLIKGMLQLLQPLSPQLKLVHITSKEIDSASKKQQEIDQFLDELRRQIKQINIVYEYVWNIDVDNGLDWVTEQPDTDLMAIVHQPHGPIAEFLKGSHTQKLARKTKIPLLVLPLAWNANP
jgi:nucleotide-binding universal stress UspA family protein